MIRRWQTRRPSRKIELEGSETEARRSVRTKALHCEQSPVPVKVKREGQVTEDRAHCYGESRRFPSPTVTLIHQTTASPPLFGAGCSSQNTESGCSHAINTTDYMKIDPDTLLSSLLVLIYIKNYAIYPMLAIASTGEHTLSLAEPLGIKEKHQSEQLGLNPMCCRS